MKKCVPIYLTISASLFLLGIQFLDVHFRQTAAFNFWTIMALVFLGEGDRHSRHSGSHARLSCH